MLIWIVSCAFVFMPQAKQHRSVRFQEGIHTPMRENRASEKQAMDDGRAAKDELLREREKERIA